MFKLQELQNNAILCGIVPDAFVMVVNVQTFGSEKLVITNTFRIDAEHWLFSYLIKAKQCDKLCRSKIYI